MKPLFEGDLLGMGRGNKRGNLIKERNSSISLVESTSPGGQEEERRSVTLGAAGEQILARMHLPRHLSVTSTVRHASLEGSVNYTGGSLMICKALYPAGSDNILEIGQGN